MPHSVDHMSEPPDQSDDILTVCLCCSLGMCRIPSPEIHHIILAILRLPVDRVFTDKYNFRTCDAVYLF